MGQHGERFEDMAHAVRLQLALLDLADSATSVGDLRDGLLARGLPADEAALATAASSLERQGLLRPAAAPGATPIVTDAGRRARDRVSADFARLRPGEGAAERVVLDEARAELDRQRADFLATVSHELRTPLTLIRTSIGLLLDGDPDAAMRGRLLRNVKQGADRMQALVTDLLDLARLRHGKVRLQIRRVDLEELAREVATLLMPLLDAKGQVLEITVPVPAPSVFGDYRRLERVLLNLLANAHKFAPRDARIAITVVAERDGATVAVTDTGPGIAPEAQARLWEQFYTGRTSSSSHDIGVGLGLPIARGIVEAHGGRIWVESAVGAGSTFRFTLPAEPPQMGREE